jgi:serine phosphatase RsbU (regulator of sigma subunit)
LNPIILYIDISACYLSWALGITLGLFGGLAVCILRRASCKGKASASAAQPSSNLEAINKELRENNSELKYEKEKLDLENKILSSFSEEINAKRKKIQWQQREISASIQYASLIQNALFPSEALLDEILKNYFIYFRPRDVVSGDFYFARKFKNKTIIVAADCTGHGVPGAFLSVLGVSLLEQAMILSASESAAAVLNKIRRGLKSTLGQNRLQDTNRDAIDMGVVIIDSSIKQINFAGANHDLFLVQANGQSGMAKGDRMPVGVHEKDFVPFRDQYIRYCTGDLIYMFTDGYPDQFGGEKSKKFGKQNFKNLLSYISELPMKQQKNALDSNLADWMGASKEETEQTDDILVIGIRL